MKLKINHRLIYLFLFQIIAGSFCRINAQVAPVDKTSSPYFIVLSEDKETDQLPLKSTTVDVDITGVIANVKVHQEYSNNGENTLEAIYVFPASTKASVYEMKMKVNDRVINAIVEEKSKASDMYKKARKEGRIASLLQEETPNVFRMKIANIYPGAKVEVELNYTELLAPEGGVYEFVYPTVVGPRYANDLNKSDKSDNWVANPYLKSGVLPVSDLNLKITLNAGISIKDIKCETHKNKIVFKDPSTATLNMLDLKGGNRDFIMQYRLAGKTIESGIMLYEDPKGENYFLAIMQPPQRVLPTELTPREYIFIVDVSGSMNGFPLDVSKSLIKKLLIQLKETDLFNIVYFAGGSEVYSKESVLATKENVVQALTFLDQKNGGGGTELLHALEEAMGLNSNEGYSRSFLIFTDGYVNVEKETFKFIEANLDQSNFFAFGIGTSVNRYIIEGIAHVGCGEPFIAINKEEAELAADRFINYVSQPVLTDIKYHFEGINTYDLIPEKMPDLFAERPLVICGKYKGEAAGKLVINGKTGKREFKGILKFEKSSNADNTSLKYLWAREKIRYLSDYNKLNYDDKLKEELISLGKKYNLLTEYTSFIAVDEVQSIEGESQITIRQPLPLPDRVSNFAVASNLVVLNDCELDEELEFYDTESSEDFSVPVFQIIEKMPEFPGGEAALNNFITSNIQFPESAAENGISGTVYVSFTIDVDGSVTDVKVLRSVSKELDEEAMRIIKLMPKWSPGKQRGKSVKTSFTVPVRFTLN
nr:TonB family protein [uncultured Carboxylicivirga sp.]